ncbi:MAG: thioesterase family protein [Planctomycetota bacterium]
MCVSDALRRDDQGRPTISVPVRVRYAECDPQGVAHHSVYAVWLELARTELLRAMGIDYKAVEASGLFCVVARMSLRYRKPVGYDDEIAVGCTAVKTRGIKIEHAYELRRGGDVVATAETTLVCVDGDGAVRPVPEAWSV